MLLSVKGICGTSQGKCDAAADTTVTWVVHQCAVMHGNLKHTQSLLVSIQVCCTQSTKSPTTIIVASHATTSLPALVMTRTRLGGGCNTTATADMLL